MKRTLVSAGEDARAMATGHTMRRIANVADFGAARSSWHPRRRDSSAPATRRRQRESPP